MTIPIRELIVECRHLIGLLKMQSAPKWGDWNWPAIAQRLEEKVRDVEKSALLRVLEEEEKQTDDNANPSTGAAHA